MLKPCGLLTAFLCAGTVQAMVKAPAGTPAPAPSEASPESLGDEEEAEILMRAWSEDHLFENDNKETLHLTLAACPQSPGGAVRVWFDEEQRLLKLDGKPSVFLRPGEKVLLAAAILPNQGPAEHILTAKAGPHQCTLVLRCVKGKVILGLQAPARPSPKKKARAACLASVHEHVVLSPDGKAAPAHGGAAAALPFSPTLPPSTASADGSPAGGGKTNHPVKGN